MTELTTVDALALSEGPEPAESRKSSHTRGVRLPPHWLAYVPAFVVLILAVLFLVLRARTEENTQAVNHSYEVMTEVDRLLIDLVSAESRQRGYLLTGDMRYLQPSLDAAGDVRTRMRNLRVLTAEQPDQQVRLEELQTLIDAKLDDLSSTLALRDSSGLPAALTEVRTDRGQNLMLQIRAAVETIQADEERILIRRQTLGASEQTFELVWRLVNGVGLAGRFVLANQLILFASLSADDDVHRSLRKRTVTFHFGAEN